MNLMGVFLVVLCGSILGGLVAHELQSLWWIGAFIGGAFSYVGYEFKEVLVALKKVFWTLTSRETQGNFWRVVNAITTIVFGVIASVMSMLLPNIMVDFEPLEDLPLVFLQHLEPVFFIGMIIFYILTAVTCKYTKFFFKKIHAEGNESPSDIEFSTPWMLFLFFNPVFVILWSAWIILRYTPEGIYYGIKGIILGMKFTARLVYRTIVLIHSDMRVSAFVGGTFGALGAKIGNGNMAVIVSCALLGAMLATINAYILRKKKHRAHASA